MIVCHCNCIKASEIREATSAMASGGGKAAPTPEQVYGALGLQPCCGGCLPLAESVIAESMGGGCTAICGDASCGETLLAAE